MSRVWSLLSHNVEVEQLYTPVENDQADVSVDYKEIDDPPYPPSKKSRRCGTCKEVGHNSRSCQSREHVP